MNEQADEPVQGTAVEVRRGPRLTRAQRPFWASQLRHPDSGHLNSPLLAEFAAPVDFDRLAAAFAAVVASSDALRTRMVRDTSDEVELTASHPRDTEQITMPRAQLQTWASERARTKLDLSQAAYDSVFVNHDDGSCSWYLNLHHLVTDATTSQLVFDATSRAYQGHQVAASTYYTPDRSDSAPAATDLPERASHFYRPVDPTVTTSTRLNVTPTVELGDQLETALNTHYRMLTPNLSWTVLLVTAGALMHHRITGQETVVVGLTFHSRSAQDRDVIGPMVGVQAIEIDIAPGDSVGDVHKQSAHAVLHALRNPGAGDGAGRSDLLVNVIPGMSPTEFAGIGVTTTWVDPGAIDARDLLRLQMVGYQLQLPDSPTEAAPDWSLLLDVNHAGADEAHRQRVHGHLTSILTQLADDPDNAVGTQSLCGAEELAVLAQWETGAPHATGPDLLVEQLRVALEASDRLAIDDGGRQLSGQQLWQSAIDLARGLQHEGVGAGDRVAVAIEPSIDATIAIFGAMLAGASFVPLEASVGRAREEDMRELADWKLRISNGDDVARLMQQGTDATAPFSVHTFQRDDEAYVLFTSGSTGKPKGVPISHGGLADFLRFSCDDLFGDEPPVAALYTSLTFDITINALFAPLLVGGSLRVFEGGGAVAVTEIATTPSITWLQATPAHLEIYLRLVGADNGVRFLVVLGAAFGGGLASSAHAAMPQARIFNVYGPTEAVIGCTIYEVDPALLPSMVEVPIGRPSPGVEFRIVDRHNQRVPIGCVGELLISHRGVTAGYLGGVDDPFVTLDETRFYRSGDLVRLQNPHDLVFVGRNDGQLKIGAARIEPLEIVHALTRHPLVAQAVVRPWTPKHREPTHRCTVCGLADNVPSVAFDDQGVCSSCLAFQALAPAASEWFGTADDLTEILTARTFRAASNYDCLHLLSGGKDSTYALHRLVELGFTPYVVTLDNGFISDAAKRNIDSTVEALGLDHEYLTSSSMNAILSDSLATHSNVCQGCFKTLFTLATTRAAELNIAAVVSGTSRGQLFETRLMPRQSDGEAFDLQAVDQAAVAARRAYHRVNDVPNRLLDTSVFADDELFDKIEFVDFYRYEAVDLETVLNRLAASGSWERPADTGWSANCLINAAGIQTHLTERGYHSYAESYAWDVRLGYKSREHSIAELDAAIDSADVTEALDQVGYHIQSRVILTAWIELVADHQRTPTASEFRGFLTDLLPTHGLPSAYTIVDHIPLNKNGKLDATKLPAPVRKQRGDSRLPAADLTATEATIIQFWETMLGIEPIAADDDFFALGGDSLMALQMTMTLGQSLGVLLSAESAFVHRTPAQLGVAFDAGQVAETQDRVELPDPDAFSTAPEAIPVLSHGERSIISDQKLRPDSHMYNVGRQYVVDGPVRAAAFEEALRTAAARHQPLSWTYGKPRVRLSSAQAVEFEASSKTVEPAELDAKMSRLQREQLDLISGPMLRCRVQPLTDGTTAVVFVAHHATCDHQSFDELWKQIDAELAGPAAVAPSFDYAGFCEWRDHCVDADQRFWLEEGERQPPSPLLLAGPTDPGDDGYFEIVASVRPEELRSGAGVPPMAVAAAALAATLDPYHDGPNVEFSLVSSARTHDVATELFGYLLNPIPIRLEVERDLTLDSLLELASSRLGAVLAHRSYPITRITEDRFRNGLAAPVTNILLSVDDAPTMTLEANAVHPAKALAFARAAVADLAFFVTFRDDQVLLGLERSGTAVDAETAANMLQELDRALTATLRAPGRTIGGALGEPARSSVLHGPEHDGDHIVDQIRRNLAERRNDPVVIAKGHSLSWAELHDRAHQLSQQLASQGLERGDRVAVAMPPSPELIVALVAVVLSRASYVPIDPAYPTTRIASSLAQVEPRFVLSSQSSLLDVASTGASTIEIDAGGMTVEDQRIAWSHAGVDRASHDAPRADDGSLEAYVIFTSGSQGQPRGVAVTYEQLAASNSAREVFYDAPVDRFLLLSSIAFDSSIVGLFWTLTSGGALVIPERIGDTDDVLHMIKDHRPSHLLTVPTRYQAMLRRADATVLERWPTTSIVAGETCSPQLVVEHYEATVGSLLVNEYGPTETSVWATAHRCRPATGSVPIGTPIAGTWAAIVDERGKVCPASVVGELIVGGAGVTNGYLNDEEETLRRFGTSDGSPGELPHGPHFRTGDKAVMQDETLHFVGRVDEQLNVGGVRFEPSEIESAIAQVAGVVTVGVVAQDPRSLPELMAVTPQDEINDAVRQASSAADPGKELARLLRLGDPDGLEVVAHIAAAEDLDLGLVRQKVAEQIPAGARPRHYTVHADLPQLPNGKIDRQALGELPVARPTAVPTQTATSSDGETPGPTPTLAAITNVFRTVLENNSIGPDDDFFDVGGHSLLALELLVTIESQFNVELETSIIYDAPTARALATRIGQADEPASTEGLALRSLVVPVQTAGEQPPIFALFNLGEDAEYIRPLSAELGNDHPFYGLGPIARINEFRTDIWEPQDVYDTELLARSYVNEIRKIAPTGPVVLLGICGGAPVAYECAQQMSAAADEAALLIMINDWHSPNLNRDETRLSVGFVEDLNVRRQYVAKMGLGPYLRQLLPRPAQRVQRKAEIAAWRARERSGKPLSKRLHVRKFIEEGLATMHGYDYQPYSGKTLVLRGADVPRFQVEGSEHSWNGILDNGTVLTVPARGTLTLRPPHVAATADAIRSHLPEPDEAQPVASDTVEARLCAALNGRGLALTLAELTSADLGHQDRALVDRAEAVLESLAARSLSESERVASALRQAGVSATAEKLPSRMTFALAMVAVDGTKSDELVAVMSELGYVADGENYTSADLEMRVRLRDTAAAPVAADGPISQFLATPHTLVRPLLRAGDVSTGNLVVDLGCGDARVLIEAGQHFGCVGRGYESDPAQLRVAREAVAAAGLEDRIELHGLDVEQADLSDADVVFMFLPSTEASQLLKSVRGQLRAGSTMVVHEQAPIPMPARADQVKLVLSDQDITADETPAITVAHVWKKA